MFKRTFLCLTLLVISWSYVIADPEEDRLLDSLYNTYESSSKSEMVNRIATFLMLDDNSIRRIRNGDHTGISIPVPVVDQLANVFFSTESDYTNFQELRRKYISTRDQTIIENNMEWIAKKTVSKDVLDAWIKYKEIKAAANGLSYELKITRGSKTAVLTIFWRPMDDFAPDSILVSSIDLYNIKLNSPGSFKINTRISKGSTSVILRRDNDEDTIILIKFAGVGNEISCMTQSSSWNNGITNGIEGGWTITNTRFVPKRLAIDWGAVFQIGNYVRFQKYTKGGNNIYKSNLEQNVMETYRILDNRIVKILDLTSPDGAPVISRSENNEELLGIYVINGNHAILSLYNECIVEMERYEED